MLSEHDEGILVGTLLRLGFDRATAAAVWASIRGRPWGETRIDPHERASLHEFVTNDAHARREPLGALTIRWRRLTNAQRLIDLEVVNEPIHLDTEPQEKPARSSRLA